MTVFSNILLRHLIPLIFFIVISEFDNNRNNHSDLAIIYGLKIKYFKFLEIKESNFSYFSITIYINCLDKIIRSQNWPNKKQRTSFCIPIKCNQHTLKLIWETWFACWTHRWRVKLKHYIITTDVSDPIGRCVYIAIFFLLIRFASSDIVP